MYSVDRKPYKIVAVFIAIIMFVVLAIPAMQGNSVYAASEASVNNNKIDFSRDIVLGTTFKLTATGDRQNVKTGAKGDERFIPSSWSATVDGKYQSGTFSGPPYTMSLSPKQIGKNDVKVSFILEVYNDTNGWEYSRAKSHIYNISFDVVREVKLNPNKGKLVNSHGYTIDPVMYVTDTYQYIPYYIPTRKGYEFTGWYTKKSGGTKIKETTKATKNSITLYAQWKKIKKVKVTLDANGGTVSKKSITASTSLTYGKLPKPKRSGYGHAGWYTKKKGGTKVTEETIVKNNKPHKLYARWGKTYTVNFNGNKGTVSKKSKKVTNTLKYGNLPTPKRNGGYQFLGWYTKKSGGTLVTADTKVNLKKNTTLYARWQKGYTITFDAGSGYCSVSSKKVMPGKKYGELPTASRSSTTSVGSRTTYRFDGWYTEDGKEITEESVFNGKSNQTLHARWLTITVNFRF